MGAVPAEAAPSAARSRHGAVAAAVPLRRHPPPPRLLLRRRRRASGRRRGSRSRCRRPSSAPRPRPLLTAPARGGLEPRGTGRGQHREGGERGAVRDGAGREHGFPSRQEGGAAPGAAGRQLRRSGKAGATPRVFSSPPPRALCGLSPRDSCGAERSTP